MEDKAPLTIDDIKGRILSSYNAWCDKKTAEWAAHSKAKRERNAKIRSGEAGGKRTE